MIRTESGRMITKNIDDITIAEYMKYEAEMRMDPWRYTRNSGLTTLGETKSLENIHQPDKLKTNDYFPLIPTCFEPAQPHTNDIHNPLGNGPNEYHLFTPQAHYETEEVSSDEDVDEWLNEELSKRMTRQDKEEEEDALIDILKTVVEECKKFYSSLHYGNLKIYVMADVGARINMMPKSLFEHLKLANLKKNSMVIEMGNMTKKAPLAIVENIRESEYFNPYEIENDDSPALKQEPFTTAMSVDTVDSSSDSQENEVGSHLSENVLRWHVCKPVHITFKFCEEDCGIWPTCNPDLNFCSGYDAIYGKEENGMLKQWMCFQDHERQNVRGNGMKFDDFLKLKAGRKIYALEEVWEKCEKFHDSTKQWYDEGFEEEELWQNGIEEIDYTPLLAKNETFEVHCYTFKNGKTFISITKQMNDVLPLGRVNGSRFIEKTMKEIDEEGGATRKT
ncbi:hypothetical protein Tco_0528651 [Tanacetum coccineum]